MLLILILNLMMEIIMHKNYYRKTNFCLLCTGYFSSDEKGEELDKEFEGDAQSILSKLHHYHTQSNVAQHEVVALTTYITNLSLTDSWMAQADNSSVISRQNSDYLTVLFLILTTFQKL